MGAPPGKKGEAQRVPEGEEHLWLSGAEVTALGVTPRALARWSETGVVRRAKDRGGQWRFHADDVEAAQVKTPGGPRARDEVLDTFRALNVQLMQHLERSFVLVHEPGQRLLNLLEKENVRLAARCESLEARHLQFLELYETMMSKQHERDVAAGIVKSREIRKDKAFEKLSDVLPTVFRQIVDAVGAKKLVESIDDGQIEVLLVAEFLSEEQRNLLKAEKARRERARAKEQQEERKT